MSRKQNKVQTRKLTISTTPKIMDDLERLADGGYYGKNSAEAAERLLAQALEKRFGGDNTETR
jgi:hypothetical protein